MSAPSAAGELLAAALARSTSAPLQTFHLPAPLAAPEALLRAAPSSEAVLFAPPDDVAIAGIGVAAAVSPADASSLESLQTQASAILATVEEQSLDTSSAPSVRFLGGVAFGSAAAKGSPVGAGRFVLPRWRYARSENEAWLSVTLRADELSDQAAILSEYRALHAALESPTKAAPRSRSAQFVEGDHARWVRMITLAREAIRSGAMDKVVLARSSEIVCEDAIDPVDMLEQFAADGGWGTRFCWRGAEASFLGLTPERLVRRSGLVARADALAGSSPTADAEQLTKSRKDASEHGIVVREIARALAPLCSQLTVPERPGLRQLRHLLHLHTPIEGVLRGPVHALELLRALHPTPAVGGVPREKALQFIESHEEQPRGLYAGPFGWFDRSGDGDFWVALRSGLVRGNRAWVWAGAGIVGASDPEAEWRETELKQRAFLRGLGVQR